MLDDILNQMSSTVLSQAERLRLAKLNNANTTVEEHADNGFLSPEEAQAMRGLIDQQAAPLRARQQQHDSLARQAAQAQLAEANVQQAQATNFRRQSNASGLADQIAAVENPHTGEQEFYYCSEDGSAPQPMFQQESGGQRQQQLVQGALQDTLRSIEPRRRGESAEDFQARVLDEARGRVRMQQQLQSEFLPQQQPSTLEMLRRERLRQMQNPQPTALELLRRERLRQMQGGGGFRQPSMRMTIDGPSGPLTWNPQTGLWQKPGGSPGQGGVEGVDRPYQVQGSQWNLADAERQRDAALALRDRQLVAQRSEGGPQFMGPPTPTLDDQLRDPQVASAYFGEGGQGFRGPPEFGTARPAAGGEFRGDWTQQNMEAIHRLHTSLEARGQTGQAQALVAASNLLQRYGSPAAMPEQVRRSYQQSLREVAGTSRTGGEQLRVAREQPRRSAEQLPVAQSTRASRTPQYRNPIFDASVRPWLEGRGPAAFGAGWSALRAQFFGG